MNVKLKNINKNVFFSRIPVHIGIKDNEKILTKLACNSAFTSNYKPVFYENLQNFLMLIKNVNNVNVNKLYIITAIWNEEWKNLRPTKLQIQKFGTMRLILIRLINT